jgi:GNAT superfamily N-acetyltransferase
MSVDASEVGEGMSQEDVGGSRNTGEGIAVARHVRNPERADTAEFAVTAIDDWQGHGVGTLLLEVLSAGAREEGITTSSHARANSMTRPRTAVCTMYHGHTICRPYESVVGREHQPGLGPM